MQNCGRCLIILQILGDFGEITLQPGGAEFDRFNRLLDGALGAGEVVSLEEVFNLESLLFAREILRQMLDESCQQEPALVLIQKNFTIFLEECPREIAAEWVDGDTCDDENGVLRADLVTHRELNHLLKQFNVADAAERAADSVFFFMEISRPIQVEHLLVYFIVCRLQDGAITSHSQVSRQRLFAFFVQVESGKTTKRKRSVKTQFVNKLTVALLLRTSSRS